MPLLRFEAVFLLIQHCLQSQAVARKLGNSPFQCSFGLANDGYLAPDEMNQSLDELEDELGAVSGYVEQFQKVFGSASP